MGHGNYPKNERGYLTSATFVQKNKKNKKNKKDKKNKKNKKGKKYKKAYKKRVCKKLADYKCVKPEPQPEPEEVAPAEGEGEQPAENPAETE